MKKICFYTKPFPRIKSYYDMIDLAVEYNLPAVEGFCAMEFETPDIENAKKIRDYADSKNIIFPCFSVFTPLAAEQETVEKLKGYADVARILGSPYLHHTIVGEFEKSQRVLPFRDELFKNGIQAVREVYDYSESVGIKAIYEEQGYVFNGIKGFGEFLEKVDRNVGIVADFGNIYESEDDLLPFLKAYADKVVHAHVKDVILSEKNCDGQGVDSLTGKFMYDAELGNGIVKIKEAVDILKSAGYNGYYALEFAADDNNSSVMADGVKLLESLL